MKRTVLGFLFLPFRRPTCLYNFYRAITANVAYLPSLSRYLLCSNSSLRALFLSLVNNIVIYYRNNSLESYE
ncbi:hypothetical protein F4774DRAFT_277929 [Daldinia eschscholtzii]|nr:hypothetical protein F4774DRAFT_277929 [Daldinia eschscholtzii]